MSPIKIDPSAPTSVDTQAQTGPSMASVFDQDRRSASLRRVLLFEMLLLVLFGAVFGLAFLPIPGWQGAALTAIPMITAVIFLLAYRWASQGSTERAVFWMMGSLIAAFALSELLWSGATVAFIVGVIVLSLMNAAVGFEQRRFFWGGTTALLGAGLILWASAVEPFPRLDSAHFGLLSFITPLAILFALILILWQIVRALHLGTIQTRLLVAFILVVLLPTVVTTPISIAIDWQSHQAEAIDQLETVAALREDEISHWLDDLKLDLQAVLANEPQVDDLHTLLKTPTSLSDQFEALSAAQLEYFRQALERRQTFREFFLLDQQGRVVLSTDPARTGIDYQSATFFLEGLRQPYLQPLRADEFDGDASIILTQPIFDGAGQVIGVLVGRADFNPLHEITLERTGLHETGIITLIDADQVVLTSVEASAQPPDSTRLQTAGAKAALETRRAGVRLYTDAQSRPVLGVYRWLPDLQVVLLVEQTQEEAFGSIYEALAINLGVTLIALLIAVMVSFFVTRTISLPLADMARTATEITNGNLELVVEASRADEIGVVADAFNRMTARLHELVSSLEDRVNQRTRRLELVATLSERLGAILDLETLLAGVVNEIKDNFNYYHAQIYLLDEDTGRLVLAEGTGQAGVELKALGHAIDLGTATSLVARAARTGEIVTVENVREAADWLPNPLLPDTYAEMAVPVVLGLDGIVVGVLDVQANHVGGLDESDATLLRSLASQIAIAIRNARLFAEVEVALAEARASQERYLERAWDREAIVHHTRRQAHYSADSLTSPDQATIALARRQARSIDRPAAVTLATDEHMVIAPIKLGRTTIGNLQFYDPGRVWTEHDLALIEATTDQIAQIAESLRLLKITQERASRERLISEATGRISRALDFDSLLQTGVAELSRVLGDSAETVIRFGSETELKSLYAPVNRSNGIGSNDHHSQDAA